MEPNTVLTRIQKNSGMICRILQAAKIILAVFAAVYLIFGGIELFQPADSFSAELAGDGWKVSGGGNFHAGGGIPTTIVAASRADAFINLKGAWGISWAAGFLRLGATFLLLHALGGIFDRCQENGRPFAPENVKGIRTAAFMVAAADLLPALFMNLLLGLVVRGISVSLGSIGLESLLWCGILLLLAQIFDYGCQLQRDSDETL